MRIFIGCSAKYNVPLKYRDLATELSTFLASRGHKLVFGGLDEGMMGKCFMTFKYEGAKTKAVVDISEAEGLKNLEVDAYDVEPSTFRRTENLYKSSEMLIILPGGLGTFAEIFSFIDEIRTRKSNIPLVLFNYNNFYTPLLDFLKSCFKEGFITEGDLKLLNIVTDINSLELYIKSLENELKKEGN